MPTFSCDAYPPPPHTQRKLSSFAKAKGTYNSNEVTTTTTTMTTTTTDINLQSELSTFESEIKGSPDGNFINGIVQPTIPVTQGASSIVEEALAPIPMAVDLVTFQVGINSPASAPSREVAVYSGRIQERIGELKNKRSGANKISEERKSNDEASRHKRRDQIVKEKRG